MELSLIFTTWAGGRPSPKSAWPTRKRRFRRTICPQNYGGAFAPAPQPGAGLATMAEFGWDAWEPAVHAAPKEDVVAAALADASVQFVNPMNDDTRHKVHKLSWDADGDYLAVALEDPTARLLRLHPSQGVRCRQPFRRLVHVA